MVVDEHNTALSGRLAALAKEQVTVVGTEVGPQHVKVDRITVMPSPPLPSAADADGQLAGGVESLGKRDRHPLMSRASRRSAASSPVTRPA